MFARLRFAAGVLVTAAGLRLLAGHGLVNYDTLYALVWGRQLMSGETPDLDVAIAPTPHPLAHVLGIVLSPLSGHASGGLHGEAATDAVLVLAFLALALLGWVVFALGREWFNTVTGVLAAAIVLTRVPVLDFGARAYVDLPYLVLVLGALLVETRRPRAGAPVLALLALAGLLRPEAWLFSGAYVLWLVWPGVRSVRDGTGPSVTAALVDAPPMVVLAAAAPALWLLGDLLIAGDPLHSLTGTRDNAELLGRVTGLQHVPTTMPRRLGEILREPVLFAAAGGGVLALLWRRDRRVTIGAGAIVLSGAAFCVLAAAGLPIITRYLLVPATLLAIFAAAGIAGWAELHAGRERTAWQAFAALAVLAMLVFVPSQVDRVRSLRDALSRQEAIQGQLADAVRGGVPCGPVTVANRRPIPLLALWLHERPQDLRDARSGAPRSGTYVRPATERVARDYILDRRDRDRRVAPVPAGFTRARGSDADWTVSKSCRGGGP